MILLEWIIASFTKGRGILSFCFCMMISLVLMFMEKDGKTMFHEVAVATVLLPVEAGLSINKKYFKVYQKNEILRKQNTALFVENEILRQCRKQNERFREMLGFKFQGGYSLIPGEIFARDPGRYEVTWLINLGKTDSIAINMPALTSKGIVGKVSKVFGNYSVIQLIQDPNCKISVLNQRSRVIGLLESFQVGKLIARFPVHSDVLFGDTLVTSGMGGVFPKGISVGRVVDENLETDDIIKGVEVRPFQNTDLVEEVFIYKKEADWNTGR
ncbi:rod shape-determining protein MreC [Fibrobacterota bacterium]